MFEEATLQAFDAALEKLALPTGILQRMGQRALAGGGLSALGATGGAGIGGLAGGIQGYRKARQEGGSGLAGALKGTVRGAAIGGGAGLAAGGLAGAAGGARAQKLVRELGAGEGRLGSISRFGERQIHSVTGATPAGMAKGEGLRAMGASPVAKIEERIGKLQKKPMDAKAAKEMASLEKAKGHAQKLEELGMTNVPGVFKSMATKPGQALKAGLGHEWHSSTGLGGKALAFGVPLAYVGSEVARGSKPGEDSRTTRGLRAAGESAAYMMGPIGLLGATGLSRVGAAAGQGAGRLLTKKQPLGTSPPPPVPEDASASGNVERVYSPAAQGRPPEGLT